MRILFLTQFFQPEPIFKGLPFARALRDRGHSVEILTGYPNYPGGKLYSGYKIRGVQRESLDGIDIVRVPLFPSHGQSGFGRMANYLSFGASAAIFGPMLVRPPDVIYVYNLVTLSLAWRVIRARHKSAVVLDVQDLWPESVTASGMMKNGLLYRMLSRWCRSSYNSADRLTVLSPGFKRRLENLGVPRKKIDVVYNWCEELSTEPSEAEKNTIRKQAGFEGKFNVLFAGTMGKAQALNSVIEAARLLNSELPNVLFTFVGGGVEVESLKARALGLGNVQFLPKRSAAEAMSLISVADALLVHLKDDPLFSITIPSKTQAYLYAGKPILIGIRGDASSLVRESGAGIAFEPESPHSLVDAIRILTRSSATERERMGAHGRRFYHDNLSFARGVGRFDDIFQETFASAESSIR